MFLSQPLFSLIKEQATLTNVSTLEHGSGMLLSIAGIRLVGCLPSSKQRQLKDFEKAVHVLKPYLAQPMALGFNRRKNVLLLVWPLIVGLFDLWPGLIRVGIPVKADKVIDEEAVKKCFP